MKTKAKVSKDLVAYIRGQRAERDRIRRWVVKQRKTYPDPENVFGLLLEALTGPTLIPLERSYNDKTKFVAVQRPRVRDRRRRR